MNDEESQELDLSQLPAQKHEWVQIGNTFYCTIHNHGAFGVVKPSPRNYTPPRDVPPRQGSRPTQTSSNEGESNA